MIESEFKVFIKGICNYFERKRPQDDTLELWFDCVKWIKSDSLDFIQKKIQNNNDTFPKNLPNAIISAYHVFMDSRLNAEEDQVYVECPHCLEGFIYTTKKAWGMNYHFTFRCGVCRQRNEKGLPIKTPWEIEQAGYDIIDGGVEVLAPPVDKNRVVSLLKEIV